MSSDNVPVVLPPPKRPLKVVVACGGTGGHLFPGLAVAQVLHDRGHELLIFISEKPIDTLAAKEADHFEYRRLAAIGLPKGLSWQHVIFWMRLQESIGQCQKIYREFQPDAILGMGGFTSLAPAWAGRRQKKPVLLHESNVIPGKANRFGARFATRILVGFEECKKAFSNRPVTVTGTPIRAKVKRRPDPEEAWDFFKLQPDRPVLLVMGGSQGAHGVNQLLVRMLPKLATEGWQAIHFTGAQDERFVAENYRRAEMPAFVAAFSDRVELAYAISRVAIARAGAASLAELSYWGIPTTLIPYPFAADDHQTVNAEIAVAAGGAFAATEAQTSPDDLVRMVQQMHEAGTHHRMSQSMKSLCPADADWNVAHAVEEAAG
ncbi:MAG: glycosyltransferase [Verrucomicrobiales bacterium]